METSMPLIWTQESFMNSSDFSNNSIVSISPFNISDIISVESPPEDGYDEPVWGLDTGNFLPLHITALSCISVSFMAASLVLIFSFRKSQKSFFSKSNVERFVVYMALCDGLFNIVHFADHMQIITTKEHPRPKALCVAYAFWIGVFISAQMLVVNVVSFSAFSLIYLGKNLQFGKYDWKLVTYAFGVPIVIYMVAATCGKLGPTGQFCHFDAVNGTDMYVYYLTLLLFIVLILNIVFYTLTWIRIHTQSKAISNILGDAAQTLRIKHTAAKKMGLLVGAFTLQWFPLAAYSICGFLSNIPDPVIFLAISLNNIGGAINGSVFLLMRRKSKRSPTITYHHSSCSTISSRL